MEGIAEKIPPKQEEHRKSHSRPRTKEFITWCNIRYRCHKPSYPRYCDYGGRGIMVCDEWRGSYKQFLSDMGPAPSPAHSIERVDNNKGYEPGNCVWADKKTQANNTRRNRLIEFNGRTQTIAQWADEFGFKYDVLFNRFHRGWSVERALTYKLQSWTRLPRPTSKDMEQRYDHTT